MRIVHLYPFVPGGRHGGTLRLRAALAGTARVGEPELHFFDPAKGTWHRAQDSDLAERVSGPPPAPGLRRRLFPSTLWESGRHARRAIGGHLDQLAVDSESVVFLHTSYLAPLLGKPALESRRSIVDAYDLVWRAHANDALSAPAPVRALRATYAATVRPRERRALTRADCVLAAGHQDYELLRTELPDVRWVPTPTPVEPLDQRPAQRGELRVGLLGNFAHQSTRASADLLIGSKLAAAPEVTIVLAGLHSDALTRAPRIEVRGALERVESLYEDVDCIVAPVVGGSGMKVKLAEAVLAGRPVVTTPLGAAGYPPSVSRFFTVCEPAALDLGVVHRAIEGFDRLAAHEALERELGWEAVLDRYAAAAA